MSPHRRPGPESHAPEFASLQLDRRRFLVVLGGIAALRAISPAEAWAKRAANTLPALQPWTLPDALPTSPIEAGRALVGAAVLAPSYFNAQPWRFEVDAGELRVLLDPHRTLPLGDPDQRFTQMSLGAALENLLVAARAWGQQPSVRYLPWGMAPRPGSSLVAAAVSWQPAERARDRLLYSALTERRSNPHPFDGRAIAIQSRTQLLAQVGEEVRVHWLEDRDDVHAVADLAHDGVEEVMADKRAQAERLAWLRGSDGDIRDHGDGVTAERLGLGGPARWFAGRSLRPDSHLYGWGSSSLAKDTRDLVRSSGAVALLTLPQRSDAGWIVGGQAYERFALRAATLGVAQHPLASPIASDRHRQAMAERFHAAGEEPLLLVRLGHAKSPSATARRGVALVSTYRTS
jgi:nitroreductase